ncbi:5-oxoprolinase subunit B family protein [Deinococcus budaensis]|uniref:KipI family sensor histidine kinase inhibitor n=1 Tax=Deinococcus budaensis TaxID=1665626 RepID=A0A7W8GG87_9DEIO|nr:allophanate hydrolase subunit 1 [Deinococcus budaensis]MBB5235106.1 KipI family sensor histidine kinase inhibitor [Deinococcus budaensis]
MPDADPGLPRDLPPDWPPDRPPGLTPLGDGALLLRPVRARALLAELGRRPLPGVLEAVPALDALLLRYDPLGTDPGRLAAALEERLAALETAAGAPGRTLTLPVAFGGPDLAWCAAHAGLDVSAFVEAVCAAPLEVAFLGFTPGFAFLSGLPPHLQMPRLPTPRARVPAGSVALGGPWAGVYPRDTPGGWRLIGHTDAPLFDLARPDPVWWQAGDRVRLVPADA